MKSTLFNIACSICLGFLIIGCEQNEHLADATLNSEKATAFIHGNSTQQHYSPHLIKTADYPAGQENFTIHALKNAKGSLESIDEALRQDIQKMEGKALEKAFKQRAALEMLDFHLLPAENAKEAQVRFYLDILLDHENPSWALQLRTLNWLKTNGSNDIAQKTQVLHQNMMRFKENIGHMLQKAAAGDPVMLARKAGLEKSVENTNHHVTLLEAM